MKTELDGTRTAACEDCRYLKSKRCELWEVKISEPDNQHCESLRLPDRAISDTDWKQICEDSESAPAIWIEDWQRE